jgi:type II secretory pathway pseudopilin PulG
MPTPDLKTQSNSRAFTLVELVVLIMITGILAATALPRFVNLADDARTTNLEAMSSSFQEGIRLVHASWIAKGATANLNSVLIEGGGRIGVNDSGWPENALAAGGDGTVTASECVDLWSGLLNSAPGMSATAGAAAWQASVQGADTCRYTYNAASGRYFDYRTSTGEVTLASGGAGAGCGLIGIEPFLVLLLVRRRRASDELRGSTSCQGHDLLRTKRTSTLAHLPRP